MSKQYSLILIISLVFISSCEKECEKNSPWLNEDLKYKCVKDKEGNSYATIEIGEQTWMAENLRSTTYANGDPIPNVVENVNWSSSNNVGAWCHYNNQSQYDEPYGKLYNWYAVADSRNLCPDGWHVPSDEEWSVLVNYLDPNSNGGINYPNNAGGKMKSTDKQYWLEDNIDATNESGFSGLPGSTRSEFDFDINQNYGSWWSSTEKDGEAWYRSVKHLDGSAERYNYHKGIGRSVRCIKD
jgi:uncharacterized protein (TIGR02145 family)